MTIKALSLLFFFAFFLAAEDGLPGEAPKTIRMMASTAGEGVMAYEIGERLGFYRQEGMRVEVVVAKISTAVQAILGGSADYLNHGSIFPLILNGLPFKVLLVNYDKSPHYLLVSPKIANFTDLIGKTVAVDDFTGMAALTMREALVKKGVPHNQVQFRVMGPPHFRFQALLSGAVDAAPLTYRQSKDAQQKGFRLLAFTGDFISEIQLSAAAAQKTMQASPQEVYKFVKGTLKARLFMFENPDEGLKFYMDANKITDLNVAKDGWAEYLRRSSELARLGRLSDETMAEYIPQMIERFKLADPNLKIKESIRAEEVFDFSLAKRAHEEIKSEGWNAKNYRYAPKQH